MAWLSAVLAGLAVAALLARPDRAQALARPARHGSAAPGGPPPADRGPGMRLVAAGGAGLAVLLVVPGGTGAALAPVVAAIVWSRSRSWESAAERRRRARIEAELPHVVDLLVAALGAGAAPTQALARISSVVEPSTGQELGVWVTKLRLGADPVAVWSDLARHPQLSRLGVTLLRSTESGAPVVAALGRLSQDLRAQRRAAVEERVRQVEVKAAVPLGICLLPAFVLVGVVPLVAGSAIGLLGA